MKIEVIKKLPRRKIDTLSTMWGDAWVSVSADWSQASCPVYGDLHDGRQVADFGHDAYAALREALRHAAWHDRGEFEDADELKNAIDAAVEVAEWEKPVSYLEIEVSTNDGKYFAIRNEEGYVKITKWDDRLDWWCWAGAGTWDGYEIMGCSDVPDDVVQAINQAIQQADNED